MSASRPSAKEVFLAARERSEAERETVVHAACGGDAELAAEVFELLAFDESFEGGDNALGMEVRDPLIGEQIGGFRIEAGLGSGGMGTVYVATQQQPKRRVALKILRRMANTPIVRRRFQNESDLLARLSHPAIAQVFEAGTLETHGDAVPFIAMELVVDALPINEYSDRRRLSIRERMALLATVCDAVQHGHQKGVIHRDLKPDNILVDRDGAAKLIDFGIARVIDTGTLLDTLQTAPGQLLGTVAYMCPEQLGGSGDDLDVRGDVYSLGVVAYELVTGRLPIDPVGDSWVESLSRIAREEPAPASSHGAHIPAILDPILARALAKSRERRYESAAAFGSDLRAMVAGRPVVAKAPGPLQRGALWVADHPLAATVALCLLLVLTVAVSLWSVASYYAMTPFALRYDPNARSVLLESRSGAELFRWSDRIAGDAHLVRLGPSGRRFALLQSSPFDPGGRSIGQVSCYPIDPPSAHPLWTTAVELEPLESKMQQNPQWALATEIVEPMDVFEELAGDELLVVQRLVPGDFVTIRVFDGEGRLRFATYHRGGVNSVTRIPGSPQLVFTALHSENTWRELGHDGGDYPVVVFAIQPRDGHRGPPAGLAENRQVKDPTVSWYRWFGPTAVLAGAPALRGAVNPALGRDRAGRFELKIVLADTGPTHRCLVSWLVDGAGEQLHCYPYDVYKSGRIEGLPPIAEGRLLPLADLPR
ncbi:MAG: serine/threonine protein kinase [bacterium]|nr:serine/threonine protein kinase [bacterium]